MNVVGYVLAGGQSTRMGQDKALLPWGEKTLLDHTLTRLRAATSRTPAILCGPNRRYENHGVPVFPDSREGCGPLGGVLTGLEKLPPDAECGLFLAVDLPLVPVGLLQRYMERIEEGIDAVVALSPRGPEPLCALYARSCLEPVRQCIDDGRLEMTAFWTAVCIHVLYPGALAEFGDPARMFQNVNAREDYERLKALA
jgi:molybdopterin-guanine dinucleotide biosynthesis protein A